MNEADLYDEIIESADQHFKDRLVALIGKYDTFEAYRRDGVQCVEVSDSEMRYVGEGKELEDAINDLDLT